MARHRTADPWSDVEDEGQDKGAAGVAVWIAFLAVVIGLVVAVTILGVAWLLLHLGSTHDL